MNSLIVITGPSGCGKTTVAERLLQDNSLERVVTATTRAPRGSEQNGKDYHFLTDQQFREQKTNDGFLETAEIYGNFYGTPKAAVIDVISRKKDPLLVLDFEGMKQVRQNWEGDNVFGIFLLPPSKEILESRLKNRATDDEDVIKKRLSKALAEIENYKHYEYTVVNDDLGNTVTACFSLIKDERNSLKSNRYVHSGELVDSILHSF